jgi:hypothetical protein
MPTKVGNHNGANNMRRKTDWGIAKKMADNEYFEDLALLELATKFASDEKKMLAFSGMNR